MRDLARSRMDDEAKITDLKKEQAELEAAQVNGGTALERIEAQKKILDLTKEIESTQDGINKKKDAEKDKADKIAADKENDAIEAEAALATKQKEQDRAAMTPEARIAAMKADQKAMMDAAKVEQDREKSAKMKLAALEVGDDISAEEKKLADEKDKTTKPQGPNVVSSSLAAVGGGGGVFVSQGIDPALAEARNQTSVLRQIAMNTNPQRTTATSKNPF
jgi:uncharacterized protein YhaN